MYDLMLIEEVKCLQNLDGKSSDEVQGKPSEVGLLEKFVQIFAENLKFQASMTSKHKRTFQPDYVVS